MRGFCFSRFLLVTVSIALISSVCFAQVAKTPLRPITVITEPNAIVWIDDVRYGTTGDTGRLSIATLSPGVAPGTMYST